MICLRKDRGVNTEYKVNYSPFLDRSYARLAYIHKTLIWDLEMGGGIGGEAVLGGDCTPHF